MKVYVLAQYDIESHCILGIYESQLSAEGAKVKAEKSDYSNWYQCLSSDGDVPTYEEVKGYCDHYAISEYDVLQPIPAV